MLMTIKKMAVVACLVVGSIALLIAFYLLITEIYFVHKATAFDASIVEVRQELVHKGKGSVMAYVPVVEIASINDRNVRMTVDAFSEEPVYRVGDKMNVLCDLSASLRCTRNTFVSKWGDSLLDFVVALAFLSIPLLHYWRGQGRSQLAINVKAPLRL
jgi:hypothetical protein